MCGAAGYLSRETNPETATELVEEMMRTIIHRGRDDGGVWIEQRGRVGLGKVFA